MLILVFTLGSYLIYLHHSGLLSSPDHPGRRRGELTGCARGIQGIDVADVRWLVSRRTELRGPWGRVGDGYSSRGSLSLPAVSSCDICIGMLRRLLLVLSTAASTVTKHENAKPSCHVMSWTGASSVRKQPH
ncbi:unnamed protein product [Diplocarpon coronariae]|nr:hypothetical protein JHW43_008128 [Diplocarpon mali]